MNLSKLDTLGRQLDVSGAFACVFDRLSKDGYDAGLITPDRILDAVASITAFDAEGELNYRQRHFETSVGLARWLTHPFPAESPARSWPLLELACSLGCEQRPDWYPEGVSAEAVSCIAKSNLDRVIERHFDYVCGFCHRRGGDEETAVIALGRAFTKYWSPNASDRFAGMSRIRTVLCAFARFVVFESMRKPDRIFERGGYEFLPARSENVSASNRADLRRAYSDCLVHLTRRERTVVDMHIRFGIRVTNIAERLGCSKSNVSNALATGTPRLRACLEKNHYSSTAM